MTEEQKISEGADVSTEKTTTSREGMYGVFLLLVVIFVMATGTALFGWFGYEKFYRPAQEKKQNPSIATLEKTPIVTKATSSEEKSKETASEPKKEESVSSTSTVEKKEDPKNLKIKVLNGGAVKGSAAQAADALKQAGYKQIETGNTLADYTGVTVYFLSGNDAAAAQVVKDLLKNYPKATSKASDTQNKETNSAPLTVVLGK